MQETGPEALPNVAMVPLRAAISKLGFPRVGANTVEDGVDAVARCDVADGRNVGLGVLLVVQQCVVGAVRLGQLAFRLGRGDCNHVRTERLAHLAEEEANAARGGSDEDPVALFDGCRFGEQRKCRQTLQIAGGSSARVDGVGKLNHALGIQQLLLDVRASAVLHHSIAHTKGRHVGIHSLDHTCRFLADDDGRLQLVQAAKVVGVDHVDAGILVANHHLARAGQRGCGDGNHLHYLGPTLLLDLERANGRHGAKGDVGFGGGAERERG
ncbi:hypothetical protein L1887_55508 [Cichorium endivia]|nr:hypothetical protein L1887_55508 [Cichorium endivia]